MKKFRNITIATLSFALLIASCTNNDVIGTDARIQEKSLTKTSVAWKNLEGISISTENLALNKELENLAKAVAVTLKEQSLQNELHKSVMARFDGETEILWNALNADRTMSNAVGSAIGSTDWSNAVAKSGGASVFRSSADIETLVRKSAKAYYANLHLYWHNAEKWDGKTAPLVTFVPTGVDVEKAKITTLTGYDAEGNMYQIDEQTAQKYPVVIIGPNERTNNDGTLIDGFSAAARPSKTARTQAIADFRLDWLSFNSAKADDIWESWFSGGPEFFASINVVNPTSYTLGFEHTRWNFAAGQIAAWQCDGRVIGGWTGGFTKPVSWDTDYYRTLNFRWFEHDPASETTTTVGLSYKVPNVLFPMADLTINASTTTKVTNGDDPMDIMTIDYVNPTRYYGNGAPFMMVIY